MVGQSLILSTLLVSLDPQRASREYIGKGLIGPNLFDPKLTLLNKHLCEFIYAFPLHLEQKSGRACSLVADPSNVPARHWQVFRWMGVKVRKVRRTKSRSPKGIHLKVGFQGPSWLLVSNILQCQISSSNIRYGWNWLSRIRYACGCVAVELALLWANSLNSHWWLHSDQNCWGQHYSTTQFREGVKKKGFILEFFVNSGHHPPTATV